MILFPKKQSRASSETKFKTALVNSNQAVIKVSADLRVQFANPAAIKLFKYKHKELMGKKINVLIEKINPQPIEASIQMTGLNTNEWTVEDNINCVNSENQKTSTGIFIKKVLGKSGQLTGFIYIFKDLSEIKKYLKILEILTREIEQKNNLLLQLKQDLEIKLTTIDENIKQQMQYYKDEYAKLLAAINNLSLGFIMTDKNNSILLKNKQASIIFTSLDKSAKSIINLQSSEQINRDLNHEIEKSRQEQKLINLTDVRINLRLVNIFISPIILDEKSSKDCVGTVIVLEDKTDKHELEDQRNDLFSIASHELRTPLTAINGYISLIKQIYFGNIKNDELRNIFNNIAQLSHKLYLNINTFLDASRLEQDKINLKKDQCDLYDIINEAIKETERLALKKNLYIKFDPLPAPVMILGDRLRLIQLLTILISNAIKFTRVGGIYISIETIDSIAKINIRDTGSGILEENQILLFNKFQQTEENLLTRHEGTGLGLYIAKLLVEKMGGTIQLEKTAVNKGSTFSFTIPLIKN